MSVTVHFIEGNKGSACKEDAYSVVQEGGTHAIAIIPASQLKANSLTPADVKTAFDKAADFLKGRVSEETQERMLSGHALKQLGL